MNRSLAWVSVVALSIGLAGCPAPGTSKNLISGINAGSIDELRQGLDDLKTVSALTAGSEADLGQTNYQTMGYAIQAPTAIATRTLELDFLRGGTLTRVVSGTRDLATRTLALDVVSTAKDADGNVLEESTGTHTITYPAADASPKTTTIQRAETVKAGSVLRPAGDHRFDGAYTAVSADLATSSETVTGSYAAGVTYTGQRDREVTFEGSGTDRAIRSITQSSRGEKSDKGSFETQFTLKPNGDGTADGEGKSTLKRADGRQMVVTFDTTLQRVLVRKRPLPKTFNALTLTMTDNEGNAITTLEFEPFETRFLPFQTKATLKNAAGEVKGEFTATLNPGKQTWKGKLELEGGRKEIDLSPVLDAMTTATR